MKKHVVLVRHGETEANLLKVVQGTSENYKITAKGLEQMTVAGIFLKGFFKEATIWSSPLGRAAESAKILAAIFIGWRFFLESS